MAIDPTKAFEVFDGIGFIEDNADTVGYIFFGIGSPPTPSNTLPDGAKYFQTNGKTHRWLDPNWIIIPETDHHAGYHNIILNDVVEIDTDKQMRTKQQITISGQLIINGELVLD